MCELQRHISEDVTSTDWHKRLAWLSAAEVKRWDFIISTERPKCTPPCAPVDFHLCAVCCVQILLEYQRDFQEWRHIIASCLQLLEDSEVRVREAISSCTRLLAEQHSAEVVQSMQTPILQSIEHNWVCLHILRFTLYTSYNHLYGRAGRSAPHCKPSNAKRNLSTSVLHSKLQCILSAH